MRTSTSQAHEAAAGVAGALRAPRAGGSPASGTSDTPALRRKASASPPHRPWDRGTRRSTHSSSVPRRRPERHGGRDVHDRARDQRTSTEHATSSPLAPTSLRCWSQASVGPSRSAAPRWLARDREREHRRPGTGQASRRGGEGRRPCTRTGARGGARHSGNCIVAVSSGCPSGQRAREAVGHQRNRPTDFIRRVATQFWQGVSGRFPDTLHPADQAIIRARRSLHRVPEQLRLRPRVLMILQVVRKPSGQFAGKAKTLDRSSTHPGPPPINGVDNRDHVHSGSRSTAVLSLVLSPADYALYKQGKCPSS